MIGGLDVIIEQRAKRIVAANEEPVPFRTVTNGIYMGRPFVCACPSCRRMYNPIRKEEFVYLLDPDDERKHGFLRAYCVAKLLDSLFENGARA